MKNKNVILAQIDKFLGRTAKLLSLKLFTSDGKKLIFEELEEDAEPKEGDVAYLEDEDGNQTPPDGEIMYTDADGKNWIFVFEEGVFKEKKEVVEEEVTAEEEVANLKAQILEKDAQIAKLTAKAKAFDDAVGEVRELKRLIASDGAPDQSKKQASSRNKSPELDEKEAESARLNARLAEFKKQNRRAL